MCMFTYDNDGQNVSFIFYNRIRMVSLHVYYVDILKFSDR